MSDTGEEDGDPFESWFREMVRLFQKIQEDMERQFREIFEERLDPEELEERLPKFRTPSGFEIRGPMVYGYYMTIGPDGKPKIRYFGNVSQERESPEEIEEIEEAGGKGEEEVQFVREPVVDVMDFDDEIVVVAEIPGVKKEDIKLRLDRGKLSVRAGHYRAEVNIPTEVDSRATKASYNNGILEVRLKKRKGV